LDRIDRSMENGSMATTARTPRTLLAEMASPSPLPPNSTARSNSPLATASATLMQTIGYGVVSLGSATPKSRTSTTRGSWRSRSLM
jgi:hypothetical protein